MKLVFLLMVCAFVAAAPQTQKEDIFDIDLSQYETPESRNILVNALVRQLIAYIRRVINDPMHLEHYRLVIPTNNLLDFELELEDIFTSGLAGFVVHKSDLQIRQLTFDLDISFPNLIIKAGVYDLIGHVFNALPLYAQGKSEFVVENFRFQCLLHLKQCDNGKSVIIDRVENSAFQLPSFKSEMTGVIGGGDIDIIVNSMINEVIIDYINRFEGAISAATAVAAVPALNLALEGLDTWKYISVFM